MYYNHILFVGSPPKPGGESSFEYNQIYQKYNIIIL